MKNPFKNEGFLIIGGNCSICEKKVCIDQQCSIFYSKRYCFDLMSCLLNFLLSLFIKQSLSVEVTPPSKLFWRSHFLIF